MGLFSFGSSKSKSSSNSASNTYVDPTQQPFRKDLMQQAQQLNNQGMPVEGVAGINPNLAGALQNQYMGGNMQAGAGAGLMGSGSALAGGSGSALNFSNAAMMGGPRGGMRAAFGAGNRFAGGVAGFGPAQGSGVNSGMANEMAGNAATMNPAAMGSASMNAAGMNAATNAGFNQDNLSNYINNDVLQGQINAATRDITRNLNENQLTASASNAAASGNSGSSRRAVMDAIATRGANDRSVDVSSTMRGNALNQALGIEANRANQNAAFQQQANQANAGFQQGANQANANFMQDSMRTNAGFEQGANQYNAGAQNSLLSQGYGIGASQLESNLGRQQQAGQFNAGAFNQARQFGTGVGQNAFNTNQQNQQFGASLAARLGAQGVNDMRAGASMYNTGVGQQLASGQYGRDFEQQLLNQQFRQGMAPYNSLNFYNQIVGAPNNLSSATSSSKGSGKSASFGFG
jgi:hypothetical protein